MRSDMQVPLPKGWPHHIRSGVIHVISLAHFSLTFARSVAANSINARIRCSRPPTSGSSPASRTTCQLWDL